MTSELISVADAERLTSISRWTWRKFAYSGKVASVKIGRRLCLPLVEVHRIVDEGRRPAVADAR